MKERNAYMKLFKSNYKKTSKIWVNWWEKKPEYAVNTNSPEHILHHPDFQYRCIQTVFVGHVPE